MIYLMMMHGPSAITSGCLPSKIREESSKCLSICERLSQYSVEPKLRGRGKLVKRGNRFSLGVKQKRHAWYKPDFFHPPVLDY
jgi:hypothetical protein